MMARSRPAELAAFLLLLLIPCACRESQSPSARRMPDKTASEPGDRGSPRSGFESARQGDEREASREARSPLETVREVHRLRCDGALDGLERYLLEDQRRHIIELVQSIDQLLSANAVLQGAVVERLGPATAAAFDRSGSANAIGVFSRDVETIREHIDGDRAVVTIQVAGRVPLEEVKLVRSEDRWLIRTDPPIPGVAGELRKLADVLVSTARQLERTPMTAAQLRKHLAAREAAVGRRLGNLTQERP